MSSKDRIGAPPPPPQRTTNNLQTETEIRTKDLNFKVPEEFHRRFKMVAVKQGVQMRDILKVMFEEYIEKHRAELGNL